MAELAPAASNDLRRYRTEVALVLLLLATIAALYFQNALLTRELTIDPASSQPAARYSYADEGMGGTSVASARHGQALAGNCSLRQGYTYPFCGFGLLLDAEQPQTGIDLTDAEHIGLDLTYYGPGELVRLTLKNRDPRYSRAGRPETDKMNKVDVAVRAGRQTIALTPSDLSVADWWIQQNNLPPELSFPQLDNVVAIELQTGPDARQGMHAMSLHRITITTRLFSQAQLYSALIILWILALAGLIIQRRRAAEALQRHVAERGRRILDAIPQMVWSATETGYEYYNDQWQAFTGVKVGGAGGLKRIDLLHEHDRAAAIAQWQHSLLTGEPYEAEYRMRDRFGNYRWVLSRGSAEKDEDGRVLWYGTCTDIHERVLAADALAASQRLTGAIINATPDCVSLLDTDGKRLFVNAATASVYGCQDGEEMVGESWLERLPEHLREHGRAELAKAQKGGVGRVTAVAADKRWWDTLIAPVLDAAGGVIRIVIVSRDISEQKAAEDRAIWIADHDALTKLPNRMVLQRHLEQRTDAPDAADHPFALVLLDVDDFKRMNDAAGHDAGDALLCAFAERLGSSVRSGDTVARLSGDEFALLLAGVTTEKDLRVALHRIMAALRKPFVHAGRVFDCSASVGAGIFGRHGSTRADLFKNVDVALYAAKAAGKGSFQIFRSAMRNEVQKRSSMLSLARSAVREQRIMPYYQPKIDLRSGEVVGFEALLRWRHPRRGIQLPAQIAAAFEDLSLAAEISDQVIDGVLEDIVAWRHRGIDVGHVAINASAAEFRRGDFAESLLSKLHAASVPVTALQLEVTETVFLGRGAECVERALKTLSMAGMKIALDDFGTGYASLSHLNQFPVNILKIDRSFVSTGSGQIANAAIIDAVINLSRSLGIEVVAEGIETQMQHDFLAARGCDQGQGFFYSPAIPANRVGAQLSAFRTHKAAA